MNVIFIRIGGGRVHAARETAVGYRTRCGLSVRHDEPGWELCDAGQELDCQRCIPGVEADRQFEDLIARMKANREAGRNPYDDGGVK